MYCTVTAANAKCGTRIGQPAADWRTVDVHGNSHALADYRGKVVVLDFWYAGCDHCLRCMPQMVAMAHEFASEPVAILGVNSTLRSETRNAAEFSILSRLTIPHYWTSMTECVSTKPIVLLVGLMFVGLDQTGIVQRVHCGELPWLKSELAGEIPGLLAAAP